MYSLSVPWPCMNHGPTQNEPSDTLFLGGASRNVGGGAVMRSQETESHSVAVRFDVAEPGLEVNVPSE